MSTRREFLKGVGLATAGLSMNPASVFAMTSGETKQAKSEKVKIAYIGIGNRGQQNIDEFAKTNMVDVVALCDVDIKGKQCEKALSMYPNAKRFTDFRKLFEEYSDHFDAVAASVPDHIHFFVAMMALKYGKHIYLEKPMVRTFQEAELLIEMAKRHPEIATQVGNQGHSEANYFQFKAWQEAGIIKDVTAVTAHMNNDRRWHKYDPDMIKMPEGDPIPDGMDWDTWHGGVRYHNYSAKFHQGDWRSWYDFGMGALGDWGAHILDTVHEFLNLGLPYEINLLYSKCHNEFFYPYSSTILFRFGARGNMPPCDVTWYDGVENLPPLPAGYGKSELAAGIPTTNQGVYKEEKLNPGKIIYSRDLIFKGGSHGSTLKIIPEEKAKEMADKLPEVPKSPSNHYVNFLRACQGTEKTRSPFEINGVLSQVFCLGVIAQRLNTQLFFDPRTKQFTNNAFANAMLSGMPPRRGWEDFYKID
ncbi:MAG: Gfo/Idh/MocA family oxidoreductase [Bacteroidaceae bacterium]|nr:Gfo/Idh/MocA family oxidoreductase [Bacteroidaceae bacterium]MBQ7684986.1 Gfo/Idh/MocA family oxidoreductase [Bacteroidaceae bacterium]